MRKAQQVFFSVVPFSSEMQMAEKQQRGFPGMWRDPFAESSIVRPTCT